MPWYKGKFPSGLQVVYGSKPSLSVTGRPATSLMSNTKSMSCQQDQTDKQDQPAGPAMKVKSVTCRSFGMTTGGHYSIVREIDTSNCHAIGVGTRTIRRRGVKQVVCRIVIFGHRRDIRALEELSEWIPLTAFACSQIQMSAISANRQHTPGSSIQSL